MLTVALSPASFIIHIIINSSQRNSIMAIRFTVSNLLLRLLLLLLVTNIREADSKSKRSKNEHSSNQ